MKRNKKTYDPDKIADFFGMDKIYITDMQKDSGGITTVEAIGICVKTDIGEGPVNWKIDYLTISK